MVVLAAVDIDIPVDVGPFNVFCRSLSSCSLLKTNWVPVRSLVFSAASLAAVAASVVSSESLLRWYTFPNDAIDLSLPSLVCSGVVVVVAVAFPVVSVLSNLLAIYRCLVLFVLVLFVLVWLLWSLLLFLLCLCCPIC